MAVIIEQKQTDGILKITIPKAIVMGDLDIQITVPRDSRGEDLVRESNETNIVLNGENEQYFFCEECNERSEKWNLEK